MTIGDLTLGFRIGTPAEWMKSTWTEISQQGSTVRSIGACTVNLCLKCPRHTRAAGQWPGKEERVTPMETRMYEKGETE